MGHVTYMANEISLWLSSHKQLGNPFVERGLFTETLVSLLKYQLGHYDSLNYK